MRPKKPLLIWSADPEQAADLAYTLNIRMHVTAFVNQLSLVDAVDLVILFDDRNKVRRIAEGIAAAAPLCPVLVLTLPMRSTYFPSASRTLPVHVGREELLGVIRIMLARKRGPMKGQKRAPQSAVPIDEVSQEVA